MGAVLAAGAVGAWGEAGVVVGLALVVPVLLGHSGNGTLVQALKARALAIQARWRGQCVA